jgi:hypothetical protein
MFTFNLSNAPFYVFDGRTECFKNKPEVLTQIQELINETI